MFTLIWTPEARETYDALLAKARKQRKARKAKGKKKSSKAEGLFKQVDKTVRLLAADPKQPSLQTHKYRSLAHPYNKSESVFEAYVQQKTPAAYRLFWCYGPEAQQITVIAITQHP